MWMVSNLFRASTAVRRKMEAEVEVSNLDGRLTPGMYATVRLVLEQSQNVLTVPRSPCPALRSRWAECRKCSSSVRACR